MGQRALLEAGRCCRERTTASRIQMQASHHHCCANTHACQCFQTHDPAQQRFYSQRMLLITQPINCWNYLNPQFQRPCSAVLPLISALPFSSVHATPWLFLCLCSPKTSQACAWHLLLQDSSSVGWSSQGQPDGKSLPWPHTTASRSGPRLQGDSNTLEACLVPLGGKGSDAGPEWTPWGVLHSGGSCWAMGLGPSQRMNRHMCSKALV